jgi:flagellar basal-body rod modification protein FlgD
MTNPIPSTHGTTAPSTAPAATGAGGLTSDAFLKVLAAQLGNQDPLAAGSGSGSDSMAQMTQLGILTQLQNLSSAQTQSNFDASVGRSMDLIGHTVSYTGADGAVASGVVQRVHVSNGSVALTIGGVENIAPAAVQDVS